MPRPCPRVGASPFHYLTSLLSSCTGMAEPADTAFCLTQPFAVHQVEPDLFHPHHHELGDAIASCDLVVLLGIRVDQDHLQLTPVPRVNQPRGVQTGNAVP